MCGHSARHSVRSISITKFLALPVGAALCLAGPQAFAASAIAAAAEQGRLETVVELIESGTDVNQPAADGSTALLWAAYQGYPEMVSALLDAGAEPNAANEFGITPLLQAARLGDVATMRLLLDAGAEIDIFHPSGETPLMGAARSGSLEAVALLLERGADPDAADILQNQTALMWAAAEGHADVVGALLDAGADPNVQARESELTKRTTRTDFPSGGFTALMFAARNADEAVARRLVEGGADLDLVNADGATAMMIAVVNDRFDFAKTLLDLGADPNDGSLYQAVLMRDATSDWLAKDSTQWRADHPNELTALDLVRIYLEAGADPNKPFVGQLHSTSMCCDTKENATPLFRAAIAADIDALELLLEHGGDLDWRPTAEEGAGGGFMGPKTAGRTPLMVAMFGGKGVGMAGGPGDIREGRAPPFREEGTRDPAEAVKLLLASGADPNALSDNDLAAIHLAAEEGKLDIIRILADAGADLNIPAGNGKTALQIVEEMPPREPPPLTGALAGQEQGAQPAEVAALLRELMGLDKATAQASAAGGDAQ